MARIAGINIPPNKHVGIALTHIFGVGRQRALDLPAGALENGDGKPAQQAVDDGSIKNGVVFLD